jgi:FKBP-type peptidyl-prolyl cis-trans isomerase FkpA
MSLPTTPAGQRLLGKAIALLAITALLLYGCERGKQTAASNPPPKPSSSAPAATPPANPAEPATNTKPADPTKTGTDAAATGDEKPKLPPIPHTELAKDAKPISEMTTPKGVLVQTMKEGAGMPTFPKALVTLHFVMYVKDGWKKVESTYESGEPFIDQRLDAFVAGLADGVVGMKPGEVRRITVPAALAWGKDGRDDDKGNVIIPPNATMVFDAELISAKQVLVDPTPKPKAKPADAPAPAPAPPTGK